MVSKSTGLTLLVGDIVDRILFLDPSLAESIVQYSFPAFVDLLIHARSAAYSASVCFVLVNLSQLSNFSCTQSTSLVSHVNLALDTIVSIFAHTFSSGDSQCSLSDEDFLLLEGLAWGIDVLCTSVGQSNDVSTVFSVTKKVMHLFTNLFTVSIHSFQGAFEDISCLSFLLCPLASLFVMMQKNFQWQVEDFEVQDFCQLWLILTTLNYQNAPNWSHKKSVSTNIEVIAANSPPLININQHDVDSLFHNLIPVNLIDLKVFSSVAQFDASFCSQAAIKFGVTLQYLESLRASSESLAIPHIFMYMKCLGNLSGR